VIRHGFKSLSFFVSTNILSDDQILERCGCCASSTPFHFVNYETCKKQHSYVDVPSEQFGSMDGDTYQVHDLLSDARYVWHGRRNYVELDPEIQPAHIFRVRRWISGDRFV